MSLFHCCCSLDYANVEISTSDERLSILLAELDGSAFFGVRSVCWSGEFGCINDTFEDVFRGLRPTTRSPTVNRHMMFLARSPPVSSDG